MGKRSREDGRPKRTTKTPYRYRTAPEDATEPQLSTSHKDEENGGMLTLSARVRALEAQLRHNSQQRDTNDLNREPPEGTNSDEDDLISRGSSPASSTSHPRRRRSHKWKRWTRPHSTRHRRRRTQTPPIWERDEDSYSGTEEVSDSASDFEYSDSDSESETERGRRPIMSFGTCNGQNFGKKLKIIEHRYIDLALLLPSSDESGPPANFIFELTDTHKKPSVTLSKPKAKPIETFDKWSEAWETFVAIYTIPKPHKKTHSSIADLFTGHPQHGTTKIQLA